jgi:predicted metal-dependent phosphotriesterase family hydrolase
MIVRTVLGDIAPEDLGVTYAHEHLIIDSAIVSREWPHIHLPSAEEAIKEATLCARAGVGAMVDAMPTGSGRDLAKLAEVSRAAGVHLIASTGMHTAKYYPGVEWTEDAPEKLARRFIAEIRSGVSGIRTGIMKVATSGSEPTRSELALIEAAAVVHTETNIPLLTHCEGGVGALAQLDHLRRAGVPLDRVILSHTDKVHDPGYHRQILGSGANVEYDQALRQQLTGSTATAELVASMWEEGFGAQIMLGTDGARRSLWAALGGAPGLAWLRSGFPAVMAAYGIGEAEVDAMFVTNPARVLSFEPT